MAIFKRRAKATQLDSLEDLKPMIQTGQPVLLDFFQFGCGPCKVMDGIINELAEEYSESAHIVKVNVGRVAGAVQLFKIRSTPTFVLLAPPKEKSAKAKKKAKAPQGAANPLTPRWRTSGLVKKDQLQRVLENHGAVSAN